MASIRQRGNRYTVQWRDTDGRQRGTTVGSKREALKLKRELERDPAIWQRRAERMTVPVAKSDRIQRRHNRSTPPPRSHGGRLSVAGSRSRGCRIRRSRSAAGASMR